MKAKRKPTPEELLVEVEGQGAAKTYEFEDYLSVIHALQQKGHSYADIAEYLKDRLGIIASRGQVYRAYQIWLQECSNADEGMEEQERNAPPVSIEDEYEENIHKNAVDLIAQLSEQYSEVSSEPWNDPESIIHRASKILMERREIEKASDDAAAEADKQLNSKKGKKDAHAK
jgi:hypothetical protein